jgi:thioesterase domain-containing protein
MMIQYQTIAQIAVHIGEDGFEGSAETPGECAISPLNDSASASTIFCFPVIAGNLTGYLPLARALGADIRVLGVKLSWWDAPGAIEWNIQKIARTCCDAITSFKPDGPYLLVGWSFGGVLALETARFLEASGNAVRVIALDSVLPTAEYREWEPQWITMIDEVLAHIFSGKMDAAADYRLPHDIRAKLRQLHIPEEMYAIADEDLVRRLAVMRGLGTAILAYAPSPIDCHVTLYQADSGAKPEWVKESLKEVWYPTVRDLDMKYIPGDHHSFLRYPIVRTLADGLRDEILDNS